MRNVYFHTLGRLDGKFVTMRHIARSIELRFGDHDIPEGFVLVSLCSENGGEPREDTPTIDFGERFALPPDDTQWAFCPKCDELQRERFGRVADKLIEAFLPMSLATCRNHVIDALTELLK